nr:hypothetical protein [Nostoc sp. NMS2]
MANIFTLYGGRTIAKVPGVGEGIVPRVDGCGGEVGWCAFCYFCCTCELSDSWCYIVDDNS